MTLARRNQNYWLPSIFNDFFENDWMSRQGTTAPAINVKESTLTPWRWLHRA